MAMSRSLVAFVIGTSFLLAAFVRLAGQAEANYPPDEIRNDFGRIVSLSLIAAPFPHRARKDGYSHEGEFFPRDGHYDDSKVSVFIPKGFEPSGSVDLVFFFHGWYSSVSEAARDFALFR